MTQRTHILTLLCALLCLTTLANAQAPAPVTLTQDASTFTLANGIVAVKIVKATGDLVSLTYNGLETLGGSGDHVSSYWSHRPGQGIRTVDAVTIDPATNGGERAEISVKGFCDGRPLGSGPGGSVVADVEIRYTLSRGLPGLYTYSIFDHKPSYPATSIGEARFVAKLNDSVFDWMTVDANRNMKMITALDWDHGTVMNMKEARRMNTGLYKGQVEHKYDYSAVQFDIPAFGWSSTEKHVGLWFVNPTIEYLSGGPTKVELNSHRDATFTDSLTAPAAPTLLNYWRGSHYGGSECSVGAGEAWTKVIGPFLLYCNAGPTPDAMWKDALTRAADEAKSWPYGWVAGVDYPHKSERGTATGQLVLSDPQAPNAAMSNILIGLAHPDYVPPRGGRGLEGGKVDWQDDAKFYQFWVRADDQGRFTIPNIRPGTYTLHAIATGVLGEYAKADVTVAPGQSLDFGALKWTPIRYGRQLWDIGIPDRTASKFLHGNDYWHWGLYFEYPKDFPNDVNYVIGKSDYRKDWNYAQVPRATDGFAARGTATTWQVHFDLPSAPHGKATLRLALSATSARHIDVAVNDQSAGTTGPLTDNATIRRDGIQGYWKERDIVFDASLLKAGANDVKLTIPADGVMSGVEYDYLRLELDEGGKL